MVDARDFATSRSLLEAVFDIANEEAWRIFVQRYRPLILAWCRRHGLQDADAEDAAATVLLKLAQAMPKGQYDPNRRFRSWLKTIIDHAVNDLLRHHRRRPAARGSGDTAVQEKLDQLTARHSSAELAVELDQSVDRAWSRARQLLEQVQAEYAHHPKTWQAFAETALKNRPAAAVAKDLNMTKAAVYMAKQRVLEKLRHLGEVMTKQESP